MNRNKEKKHHFLYYIFQIDKERCMMENKKTSFLKQWFETLLALLEKRRDM